MVLTVSCIAVALGAIIAVGIPISWILNGRRPLTELDWIRAPFLGVATVVLFLQNLVYLNVPIRVSAPFLWAATAVLWLWMYRSGQLRVILARCPRAPYAVALLAYLLHGLGLLRVGARYYVGKLWLDQFNYTVTTQLFMEEHFSLGIREVGSRPYLLRALVTMTHDRIGQSMLQGFFAVSARSEAKALFEPTILLGVPLVVLAVFALARHLRLGRGPALATGAVAGLLPAVAVVHLESFLSQALATPFLLYLPAGLYELSRRPSRGRLAGLLLIVAGATSIYSEYWLVYLGLSALLLGLAAVRDPRRWKLAGCGLALAASTFILNPMFTPYLLAIQKRVSDSHYSWMSQVYPWAFQLEGLGYLWAGDLVGQSSRFARGFLRTCGLGVTALGYFGLLRVCWDYLGSGQGSWQTLKQWRLFALTAVVLALAALPAVVLARDDTHPYQFYKLLLSVSPLLVLGLGLLCQLPAIPVTTCGGAAKPGRPEARSLALPLLVLGAVGILALMGTSRMVRATTLFKPTPRCNASVLIAPDACEVQDRLEALRNRDLLIAIPYYPPQQFLNGWFAYFARRNRVWLADPTLSDLDVEQIRNPGGTFLQAGSPVPTEDLLLLTSRGNVAPGGLGGGRLLWGNNTFELWKPGAAPWAIALRELHLDGDPGLGAGQPAWCINQGMTTLELLASASGTAILTGQLRPPSAARLRVQTSAGYTSEETVSGSEAVLSVPVLAGKTVITLTPLGPTARAGC